MFGSALGRATPVPCFWCPEASCEFLLLLWFGRSSVVFQVPLGSLRHLGVSLGRLGHLGNPLAVFWTLWGPFGDLFNLFGGLLGVPWPPWGSFGGPFGLHFSVNKLPVAVGAPRLPQGAKMFSQGSNM